MEKNLSIHPITLQKDDCLKDSRSTETPPYACWKVSTQGATEQGTIIRQVTAQLQGYSTAYATSTLAIALLHRAHQQQATLPQLTIVQQP